MKLNELLLELGNTWYPFEVTNSDDEYLEVSTNMGLNVYFSTGASKPKIYDTVFIEFTVNGKYELTGQGDAFRIIATVKKIIETYLPKYINNKINTVQFASEKSEPSRIKLYKRAIPIVSNILGNDWKYTDKQERHSGLHIFRWERKEYGIDESQMDLFGDNKVYYIMINGVFWMDKSKPKKFYGRAEAEKVVQRLFDKYGKPAQVVDPDRYPIKYDQA